MRQEERRAQTTQRLLDAAADVFARLGFHAATLDDVADAAGYTKGAVYSNFAGKDALFLALLDRHLDDQLAQVERLTATASDAELHSWLQAASSQHMSTGGTFGLLTLEFWLYAARHNEAKAALAARYRRMRDRLAAAIAQRDAESDAGTPRAPDDAATLVLALDAGLSLQHLIDPDAITPELRARAITDVLNPPRR
jgi:AcrR family transcriptional regulator